MLQYIINASLIWLSCLVIYDLLLRRETFHQYNRAYLLLSLAAGLLLPMADLNNLLPENNNILREPTVQVYELKKAVFVPDAPVSELPPAAPAAPAPTTAQASAQPTLHQILLAIYILGMAAGLIIILREAFHLIRLYSTGLKSREHGCVIVETGKVHCAFSFFSIIFVGDRSDYDLKQWTILLEHEKEHSRQLHSFDNIALIILRIICWFHPLPHIYYRRLMMIHEFQADAVAARDKANYGSFLLEQSLLSGAPVLTHSFNYSPIKNRIAMLTGTRSTRTRLLKYLAVIPLSLILILFCTQMSFSVGNAAKQSKVYFKGNEIVFGTYKAYPFEYLDVLKKQKEAFLYAPLPDTIPVKDRVTGNTVLRPVPLDTTPVAINGKPIFGTEARYGMSDDKTIYTPPVFTGLEKDAIKFLFSRLADEFNKLDNGLYYLDLRRVVVDDKGDLAYYESKGIVADGGSVGLPASSISADHKRALDHELFDLLNGPMKFTPALRPDGTPINARMELPMYEIEVKDHKAKLFERKGC